jgi:hypothetical protein
MYANLPVGAMERESIQKLPFALGASYINSPRRAHLVNAGERLMADGEPVTF